MISQGGAPHTVIFYLYVKPEAFERYVEAVKAAQVDQAVLSVKRVAGFYSDWSPAISTSSIKVLTDYAKDHPVEVPKAARSCRPGSVTWTRYRSPWSAI